MINEEKTFENAVLESCYAKLRNHLYKTRFYRSAKVDIAVCTHKSCSNKIYFHRLVNNTALETENRNLFTLTRSLNSYDPYCYYDGVTSFEKRFLEKNKLEFLRNIKSKLRDFCSCIFMQQLFIIGGKTISTDPNESSLTSGTKYNYKSLLV